MQEKKQTRLAANHAQVQRPLRLTQELDAATQAAAEAQGVKWSQWMREAAEQRLERDRRKARREGGT